MSSSAGELRNPRSRDLSPDFPPLYNRDPPFDVSHDNGGEESYEVGQVTIPGRAPKPAPQNDTPRLN